MPIKRTKIQKIDNTGKDKSNRIVRAQNGIAALENSLGVSCKAKQFYHINEQSSS